MSQPPSYTDPTVIQDLKNSAAASGNDYKCIVTFFYYGGMDTHNLLVPTGSNPNLATYESLRAEGVRMEQNEILPLGVDATWGLHENFSFVKSLWDDGDVAFIHDTGALNVPTKKDDFISNTAFYSPNGLYGHNTQQNFWMGAEPLLSTGWFGRTSNLLDPTNDDPIFNVGQVVDSSAITIAGSDLQSKPYSPMASVNYKPILPRELNGTALVSQDDMNDASDDMAHAGDNPPPRQSNLILNSFIDIFNDALDSQIIASESAITWNNDDSLSQAEKDIINGFFSDARSNAPIKSWVDLSQLTAEIIYSARAEGYNQRRQTIFVPFGGWDHHASLRAQEDNKLLSIDYAIKALVQFLKQIGLYDSVAICHGSEFSRTLSSNASKGTDHAWASHSFVIGGPVKGGFYPTNYSPIYDPSGIKSDGSPLGRYIPEVSIEQYYAEILDWFGIPRKHLHLVLPRLTDFTTSGSNNSEYIFANKPSGTTYSIDFI